MTLTLNFKVFAPPLSSQLDVIIIIMYLTVTVFAEFLSIRFASHKIWNVAGRYIKALKFPVRARNLTYTPCAKQQTSNNKSHWSYTTHRSNIRNNKIKNQHVCSGTIKVSILERCPTYRKTKELITKGLWVLNKFLYREAKPPGPTPHPFIHLFSQKRYPFHTFY